MMIGALLSIGGAIYGLLGALHAVYTLLDIRDPRRIVPDNPLARQFRDLAGWTNQRLAAIANEVVFTVAGIPMIVKQATSCP